MRLFNTELTLLYLEEWEEWVARENTLAEKEKKTIVVFMLLNY